VSKLSLGCAWRDLCFNGYNRCGMPEFEIILGENDQQMLVFYTNGEKW